MASCTKNTGSNVKTDRISETGMIGEDGRLRLPMDRLSPYFQAHKGMRVVVKFEANAPKSTAAQQAYYYNYIVPTIQQALREKGDRKREDATDRFLISQYPGDFHADPGEYITTGRQLNQTQMFDFLEWLKQYAAEWLHVYIDDPRTI